MGDGAAIQAEHAKDDISVWPEPQPQKTTPCTNCHISDWRSPAFSDGIVWQGKTAREICTTVNAKLPTAEAKIHHFHDDPRIEWAITGKPYPVKAPALTIGFDSFLKMVDTWIYSGAPCPES